MLKIIQAVQPHIVAVELCRARVGILQLDEEILFGYAKNIDYSETEFLYLYNTSAICVDILYYLIYLQKLLWIPLREKDCMMAYYTFYC